MTRVREAAQDDNAALVRLAALCPMQGDVSLCVRRSPDFFALSRLEGDPWKVGVVDGDSGPIGCIGVARRHVYRDGSPAHVAYIGDLKVHPEHRRGGVARDLVLWAQRQAAELVGEDGLRLSTTLAGNATVEAMLQAVAGDGFRTTPYALLRSYSITLLWRRRLPNTPLTVYPARPQDVPEMTELWRQVAPTRQLAPVSFTLADGSTLADGPTFANGSPGPAIGDHLLARSGDGSLAGFFGLWDQHALKQMVVAGYSLRLSAVRTVANALTPLTKAAKLPPPGGELRYRSVVNLCVPDAATLRVLLMHAYDRLQGSGDSFFTIGLDAGDPLTAALKGLFAQPTDASVLIDHVRDQGPAAPFDGRPLHFEIATI